MLFTHNLTFYGYLFSFRGVSFETWIESYSVVNIFFQQRRQLNGRDEYKISLQKTKTKSIFSDGLFLPQRMMVKGKSK